MCYKHFEMAMHICFDSFVLFPAILLQVVEKFHNSPLGDSDNTLHGMVDGREIKFLNTQGLRVVVFLDII